MPKTKYYRVGERPPPRGPATDRLWQPPSRSAPDDAAALECRCPCLRCRSRRRSRRRFARRSLRPNSPMPANHAAS